MKIETNNLILLSTYAKSRNCTTANIYKYIDKYNVIEIDGLKFLDKTKPLKIVTSPQKKL